MAVILVLAAGLLGFATAVLAWAVFGVGILAALGLWSGAGVLGVGLALGWLSVTARKDPPAVPSPQAA